jgi:hypothetical protein
LFLLLSFIHPYPDKTLEEEFLSILKQCDISQRNFDRTEKSLISHNVHMQSEPLDGESRKTLEEEFLSILKLCGISPRSLDGESCHNSTIDSAHFRDNIRVADNMYTTVVVPTKQTSITCPSSARSPRIEFPISKLMDDPPTSTTSSPLLNPNAIHVRRSFDMKIQEDCCNDDVQENEKRKFDVGDCYYAATANVSSDTYSFRKKMSRELPMVRVLSPAFARHQRKDKTKAMNELSSIVRPPRSKSFL